jgi:hypothetical protein
MDAWKSESLSPYPDKFRRFFQFPDNSFAGAHRHELFRPCCGRGASTMMGQHVPNHIEFKIFGHLLVESAQPLAMPFVVVRRSRMAVTGVGSLSHEEETDSVNGMFSATQISAAW